MIRTRVLLLRSNIPRSQWRLVPLLQQNVGPPLPWILPTQPVVLFLPEGPCTVGRRWFSGRFSSDSNGDGDDQNNDRGNGGNPNRAFRPRRRSHPLYRPVRVRGEPKIDEVIQKSNENNPYYEFSRTRLAELEAQYEPQDELDGAFGPRIAALIRGKRAEMDKLRAIDEHYEDSVEETLRMSDYLTSEPGSVEQLVGLRRGLSAEFPDDEEAKNQFLQEIDDFVAQTQEEDLLADEIEEFESEHAEPSHPFADEIDLETPDDPEDYDRHTHMDRNQLAHGIWSEYLVDTGRTTKLWRGGRIESFRALVIGGNMNGCGGFGIGKGDDPAKAVNMAGRVSKRNIFFFDRYLGDGMTRHLAGRQNSCKVVLRRNDNGLSGNELCREILKRFGIVNCSAKAYGNRNPYNVVQATFKALMTHESIEDVAMKRGRRLVSLDRAMRMQV